VEKNKKSSFVYLCIIVVWHLFAGVLLNPILAAAAMGLASVSVAKSKVISILTERLFCYKIKKYV